MIFVIKGGEIRPFLFAIGMLYLQKPSTGGDGMEKKDSWGLTEEEIKERLRKLNQEKEEKGPTRGGRSSGQGVIGP